MRPHPVQPPLQSAPRLSIPRTHRSHGTPRVPCHRLGSSKPSTFRAELQTRSAKVGAARHAWPRCPSRTGSPHTNRRVGVPRGTAALGPRPSSCGDSASRGGATEPPLPSVDFLGAPGPRTSSCGPPWTSGTASVRCGTASPARLRGGLCQSIRPAFHQAAEKTNGRGSGEGGSAQRAAKVCHRIHRTQIESIVRTARCFGCGRSAQRRRTVVHPSSTSKDSNPSPYLAAYSSISLPRRTLGTGAPLSDGPLPACSRYPQGTNRCASAKKRTSGEWVD
jgi:hypothetical protein